MAKAHGCMDKEDANAYKVSARATEICPSTTSVMPAIPSIWPTPIAIPVATPMPKLPRGPPAKQEWPRDPSRVNSLPNRSNSSDRQKNPMLMSALTTSDISLTNVLTMVQKEGYLKEPAPQMREAAPAKDNKKSRSRSPLPLSRQDNQPSEPSHKGVINTISGSPTIGNQPSEPSHKGVINTISGSPTIGWSSNNAQKRYAKRALRVNQGDKRMKAAKPISFGGTDLQGVKMPHDDPILIIAAIDSYQVKHIIIDTRSSVDILGPLIGFSDHSLLPEGMITLPLIVKEYPRQATIQVQFLVMDLKSAHNVIIGRIALHLLRTIPSTYHQMVKFPTPNGVEVTRSNQQEAKSYYMLSIKGKGAQDAMPIKKAYL
ncbi:uncharacterized protein LOC109821355 [Asparagus officinalis]|uniref:uncharacterized protein LOC109821355 n=1 Tax=Asparagus officinalis TaxID=4686 RepID=UPI00098E7938|nr:uncharacterized protein LOC109821355 [Asparagus officinalis]